MGPQNIQHQSITTARIAGVWYLLLAVCGILGFAVVHPQIFVTDNPAQTLSNLITLESTARVRLLLEFAIVTFQALTAAWFYKLFKRTNDWAAWTVGIGGMMNAVVVLVSAISMGAVIEIAGSAQSLGDKLVSVQVLSSLIENAWGVGGLFFGLWLLPLGYIITTSKRMPVWLGRTMLAGGTGYLLSTILTYGDVEVSFSDYLTLPATVGEFWMIGYLLIYGIRPVDEYRKTQGSSSNAIATHKNHLSAQDP